MLAVSIPLMAFHQRGCKGRISLLQGINHTLMDENTLIVVKGTADLQKALLQVLIDHLGCPDEHDVSGHFTNYFMGLQVVEDCIGCIVFCIAIAHLLEVIL